MQGLAELAEGGPGDSLQLALDSFDALLEVEPYAGGELKKGLKLVADAVPWLLDAVQVGAGACGAQGLLCV